MNTEEQQRTRDALQAARNEGYTEGFAACRKAIFDLIDHKVDTHAEETRKPTPEQATICEHDWLPHFHSGSNVPRGYVCRLCGDIA